MNDRSLPLFLTLSMIFVGALITANIIASKIIMIGGMVVPAGVLAYSVTFAMTDTICEIWGRERTQWVVRIGFLVQTLVFGLIIMAIYLPTAPFWHGQEAYNNVLGTSGRIILASLTAYAISQSLDVYIFSLLKKFLQGRHLWLRNNLSTFISQTVDTLVFITIAFAGQMDLLPLILGQITVKWIIAALDTPVVYGLVLIVRQRIDTAPPAAGAAA
ncbi:MAG: queuosine precursor transporter [Deltaproteobacteria bacterium]|nr:queuosine precursor transporter [Deltaproteobacteria bacterium]